MVSLDLAYKFLALSKILSINNIDISNKLVDYIILLKLDSEIYKFLFKVGPLYYLNNNLDLILKLYKFLGSSVDKYSKKIEIIDKLHFLPYGFPAVGIEDILEYLKEDFYKDLLEKGSNLENTEISSSIQHLPVYCLHDDDDESDDDESDDDESDDDESDDDESDDDELQVIKHEVLSCEEYKEITDPKSKSMIINKNDYYISLANWWYNINGNLTKPENWEKYIKGDMLKHIDVSITWLTGIEDEYGEQLCDIFLGAIYKPEYKKKHYDIFLPRKTIDIQFEKLILKYLR